MFTKNIAVENFKCKYSEASETFKIVYHCAVYINLISFTDFPLLKH